MNYVHGASIMAVDDEPDNLRLLTVILRGEGAVVRGAVTGEIAIESMLRFPPDLVLLDIGLPEIDGFEVAERMNHYTELREVPVIFLSGRTALADKIEAFSVGAVDYIEKPFQASEVLARVRTHLDLTSRRREEIRRAEMLEILLKERELLLAERERFTAMIVHDMRSPLQVIASYLELEELREASDDQRKAALHACETLGFMTTNALEMSRIATGSMPLNETRVQARSVIDSAIGLLPQDAKVIIEDVEGTVQCDRYLVTRVLLNLLNNALEHGTGQVSVGAQQIGHLVRFEVADQGQGIDTSKGELMFEPYVSGHTGALANARGLGLTFCRAAINAHGGKLGFERAPDNGSVFWFTLHADKPNDSSATKKAS